MFSFVFFIVAVRYLFWEIESNFVKILPVFLLYVLLQALLNKKPDIDMHKYLLDVEELIKMLQDRNSESTPSDCGSWESDVLIDAKANDRMELALEVFGMNDYAARRFFSNRIQMKLSNKFGRYTSSTMANFLAETNETLDLIECVLDEDFMAAKLIAL